MNFREHIKINESINITDVNEMAEIIGDESLLYSLNETGEQILDNVFYDIYSLPNHKPKSMRQDYIKKMSEREIKNIFKKIEKYIIRKKR